MKQWALALMAALSLAIIAHIRTDGFSPSVIQGPLQTKASLPPSLKAREILAQPFHYLSKGRQCFVFESADGKYVLKFFNQKYLQMPWYSFLVGKQEAPKRAARRHFYENSYEIAQRELGEEILYLHLGPSEPLDAVKVVDQASSAHTLDITSLPFVLQKKGMLFYPALQAAYQKEGMEGLCRGIDAFIAAVSLRISKNIADADRDVGHNWGYVEGRLFHLDPGRLYYESLTDPARQKEEWRRSTHSFHKWLRRNYPEAAKYFANQLAKSDM